MEEKMQKNDKFQNEIKDICEQYGSFIEYSTLFTQEHRQKVKKDIEEKVLPLLQAQKPKIMVYGIYNSGKSTLVNAICKRAVAEVADRPMTDRITEYDEGRYTLIDSPGVNAPIQHEEIADRHLHGCHIILFVISSKGIFEDRVNYEKMWELIKRGLPFYIVLNDRGATLPPKEEKALREQTIREHNAELNNIKRKIIKNLMVVSKMEDVGEKYDVIVLNAKRAWNGIAKKNEILYQKSNISVLTARIDAILNGSGALKQLLAPLSALEEIINESESFLIAQSGGQDFATKRETMNKKISVFRESFLADIQLSVEKQFERLYNGCLGVGKIEMEEIWEEVCKDVENSYTNQIYQLNQYMRKAFEGLGLIIDDRCNISSTREEIVDEKGKNIFQKSQPNNATKDSFGKRFGGGRSTFVENTGRRDGIGLLDAFFNLFKSKRKKEQEEFERLTREVDAYNAEASQRLEEDIRRHQDARTNANAVIDKMASQLRIELSDNIRDKFDRVMRTIDDEIQAQGQRNEERDAALENFRDLKNRIYTLRRGIG